MNRQFFIVITACILGSTRIFAQPAIPNAGFEQPDPSSPTQTAYWATEGDNFTCIADSVTSYRGAYSLKVSSRTNGNHFFNEEFPFNTQGLKKYKIKCAFQTKDLSGAIQLGTRVFDVEGGTITKTIFPLTENANQDWTTGDGIFVSDKSASKLRVFGNLFGVGEAWFDDIVIEELPAPQRGPSPEVALYVHEYFDIVYENSIIKDKNFIADLKSRTMYLCADSIDLEECHSILQYYTTPMLKDGHSFFTISSDWKKMGEQGRHPTTGQIHHDFPSGKLVDGNIGYILIPTFISADEQLMQLYSDSAQKIILGFDRRNVEGYIVDLSKNGGGNSLPMIAGVGPLIGDGICGYSLSGNGSVKARVYKDGAVGWDTTLGFKTPHAYKLKNKNKPIAVIYGSETASSGEVTATAFIGLANSKSFGAPTFGATTRVDNFEMSDGSFLNLASGTNADRHNNKHDGPIEPDVETRTTEDAIKQAVKWIEKVSR